MEVDIKSLITPSHVGGRTLLDTYTLKPGDIIVENGYEDLKDSEYSAPYPYLWIVSIKHFDYRHGRDYETSDIEVLRCDESGYCPPGSWPRTEYSVMRFTNEYVLKARFPEYVWWR